MKYNILITDILIKDFVHVYKKDFSVDCLWKLKSKIDFNKYQGIVVTGGFKTDKKFLKKFKNLKIVSVFGVGYDGVDLNYCKNKKIVITNTPKVLTDDVADLALGLMISLSRRINEINHNEKSIILVCETGGSSPNAGETLKKEGYKDIYILRGGINQWKMDNLPLV